MISNEDKERVREATDIVQLVSETVVLKPRGSNDFWGCCPFHQEKSPSFHVTPSTGLWHCFGCGTGGDVFDYTMRREGLEFADAIRYLADRAHIDIEETRGAGPRGPKRTRLIDALEAAQQAFATRLMRGRGEGPDEARRYLAARGLNSKVCAKWHLGYADPQASLARQLQAAGFSRDELVAADLVSTRNGRARDQFYNRVMFPIHDERGQCIGFGGRVMGDAKPKYLNTRETSVFHKSKHMFAFDYAKDTIAAEGYAIVTEGYMDVIAMHEAGFTNTVAALGTALSLDHVKTLSRFAKRIICMFDGDAAGQHAAEAAVRYIEATKAELLCVVLPGGQDPDEFLREHGADEMRAQLAAARPLLDFVLEKKLADLDLTSPGLRLSALDELAPLLAPFKDSYLLDSYAQRLVAPLGMSLDSIRDKIKKTPIPKLDDTGRWASGGARTTNYSRAQNHNSVPPHGDARTAGAGTTPPFQPSATSRAASSPYDAPVYDDAPYEDVPYDYVPEGPEDAGRSNVAGGWGGAMRSGGLRDFAQQSDPDRSTAPPQPGGYVAPATPSAGPSSLTGPSERVPLDALTPEDRTQITAERNLLTMLAAKPDLFRPYAERIATFVWADSRHEAIAWAILATPEGTSPADAVRAATLACGDAPAILSSGEFAFTSSWDDAKNVEFVVTEAEIRSLDRRCATLSAQLAAETSQEASRSALQELLDLRRHRAELRASQPLE